MEQAIRDGWTEVQFTPDGLAETFLGYLPSAPMVNKLRRTVILPRERASLVGTRSSMLDRQLEPVGCLLAKRFRGVRMLVPSPRDLADAAR
jgi:hypothetical protein